MLRFVDCFEEFRVDKHPATSTSQILPQSPSSAPSSKADFDPSMADPKIFSLEGQGLKLDTAEDIEPHIKPLYGATDIEEVRLLGNTFGIGASEALAKALEPQKNLQVANLADIFTSRLLPEIPPALDAILKALLTLPKLHTIDLSDNAFGLNTQAPLVSFLSAHTPLEHLYLNNNGLGAEAGTLIANALSSLGEKKREANAPPLQTIVCGRNRLENGSMVAWAKAFAAHPRVTHVRMVQNGIRQEGVSHLIREGLRHAKGLKVLDLQDNTFTAMGAKVLTDVIHQWEGLQELGISDCYLGARGGVMLVEALREGKNQGLEVLRLQYNDIDARGVKALADAQEKLPKLRRVELNGNKFNEDDVNVDRLKEALHERREKFGPPLEEGEHEDWGMDELDELEEESEEEEEELSEAEEEKEEVIKRSEEAEEANVAEEKSKSVDELADMLGKTEI